MKEIWCDAQNGQDTNDGTQSKPLQTPKLALQQFDSSGGILHLKGIFYTSVSVKNQFNPPGLIIDGHDKTMIYGFEGTYQPFNPAKQPYRNWHRLSFADAHNVTAKNMTCWGGCECTVELNSSHKELGLKNITLENLTVKYGAPRNIFMGGSNIDGITIKGCTVREDVYGDTTHGIYLSGGHWTGDCPPVRNVEVSDCDISYTGGRHGIQCNGRFENVKLKGNRIYHCELAGISLIGCQHVLVEENQIYGNNRQAIVIYDYADGWFDPGNPEWSEEVWRSCHHPNQDILIRKNTLVCGPHQWKQDAWHNNDPRQHGVIHFNNEVNGIIDYPPKDFYVYDNIIHSCNEAVIRYSHMAEAWATRVQRNMVWTTKAASIPVVNIPWGDKWFHFHFLETEWPYWYMGNMVHDPKFRYSPQYPKSINLMEDPAYDFGKHPSYADLYSIPGANHKMGATLIEKPKVMK